MYIKLVTGYKGGEIVFLLSISPEGVYNGYHVVSMIEQTSGIGTQVADEIFYEQFLEKDISSVGDIVKIDQATLSSQPVIDAIKAATKHFSDHESYR